MATANDKLQDESIAHAIWIARYSTSVANRMIKILNDSDAELTARLLVAMDSLDADSFTVSRLEALLVSVRALNREAVQSMYAGLSDELQQLAQHEAGFQLSLSGTLLISRTADQLTELFEFKDDGKLSYFAVSAVPAGETDGWLQLNLQIPYRAL